MWSLLPLVPVVLGVAVALAVLHAVMSFLVGSD